MPRCSCDIGCAYRTLCACPVPCAEFQCHRIHLSHAKCPSCTFASRHLVSSPARPSKHRGRLSPRDARLTSYRAAPMLSSFTDLGMLAAIYSLNLKPTGLASQGLDGGEVNSRVLHGTRVLREIQATHYCDLFEIRSSTDGHNHSVLPADEPTSKHGLDIACRNRSLRPPPEHRDLLVVLNNFELLA